MNSNNAMTETDLHAYVDGHLGEADRLRVEAWLADHPEDRTRIEEWQAQARLLRSTFAPYETGRDNDRLLLKAAPRRWAPVLMRTAAACLIFTAGAVAGQFLPQMRSTPLPSSPLTETVDISAQSKSAYLIYASEVRHPVEVGADQQQHLGTWLGKRLGAPFTIPDLTSIGFDLVGGRLVPVSNRPGAMLMYQNKAGQRVTVLIGHNPDNRETSFRLASADGIETFYWIDNGLGYAVSGEVAKADLQKIAEECYRQFPA
jgi:anti-sigma factor RsiW